MNIDKLTNNNSSIKTIGIIGGGQLGRMICFAAHKMGFKTVIFSDQDQCVASFVTNNSIIANYDDYNALDKFAEIVDIITFEFENIPLATIKYLSNKVTTYPNAQILKITQNRILEKEFLNKIAIKTANYSVINNKNDIVKNLAIFKKAIIKTAIMGYDGKGQYVITENSQIDNIWHIHSNNQLIMEEFCSFDFEVSIIIARSSKGEVACYEAVENIHKNSILYKTTYPSSLNYKMLQKAQAIAINIADELDLIGVLAVEFFVLGDDLYVNELAPRPHNSGHITMDLCYNSQFDQLIKAICGFKLGDVSFFASGYMQNIIGSDINKIQEYQNNPKAKIHLYDKKEIIDGRKLGHINIIN